MAELFQTHASKSQRLWSAVHTPSSQRVFNRQALNQVATGRFPLQEIYTVYLQLEILYFHTPWWIQWTWKLINFSCKNHASMRTSDKNCQGNMLRQYNNISTFFQHYEWAHHYPRALRICLVWVESTTSSWMFLKRYMTLKSFQAWKIHGFSSWQRLQVVLVLEVWDLKDVALLIFFGGSRNG